MKVYTKNEKQVYNTCIKAMNRIKALSIDILNRKVKDDDSAFLVDVRRDLDLDIDELFKDIKKVWRDRRELKNN